MAKMREPNTQEREIKLLSDDEVDAVSGGSWRTQKIHMDYHNLNNFNDPTAVRIA
jgi:hypothetical protein